MTVANKRYNLVKDLDKYLSDAYTNLYGASIKIEELYGEDSKELKEIQKYIRDLHERHMDVYDVLRYLEKERLKESIEQP